MNFFKKEKIFIILLIVFCCSVKSVSASDMSAEQIKYLLTSIDDLWRGKSSHSINTMIVKTKHYTRKMRLENWTKGEKQSLTYIMTPLKDKGLMTLKSGTSIYNYLPKTNRKIRLTSGMMMGSWMGSHFTNDDLVKNTRLDTDYTANVNFEGERNGKKIIEIILIPKPDAPVVWGKVVLIVLKDSHLPLTQIYYDEDMKISRTFIFSGIKMLAGRNRPSIFRVIPADKPDEYTQFIYESLELNFKVKKQFFSVSNLKRR